jgi:hypothetical protein
MSTTASQAVAYAIRSTYQTAQFQLRDAEKQLARAQKDLTEATGLVEKWGRAVSDLAAHAEANGIELGEKDCT